MSEWTPERIAKMRRENSFDHAPSCQCCMCDMIKALDEIERLQARVAELKAANDLLRTDLAVTNESNTAGIQRDQRRERLLRELLPLVDMERRDSPSSVYRQELTMLAARIRAELGDER